MENTPQPPQYFAPQPQVVYVQQQPKAAGLAVASMVLGILGLFFGWLYLVPPVLAVIFSGVALNQIKQRGLGGKGMAITGLVLGIVGTALYGLILLAAIGASNA